MFIGNIFFSQMPSTPHAHLFFFLSPSYINIIIAVERKKSDTAPVITRNVLLKVFGLGKIFCLFDISYEIVFFFFSSLNAIRDGFLFWSSED